MSVDEWLEKMDMTECLDKGPFSTGSNEKVLVTAATKVVVDVANFLYYNFVKN